MAENTAGRKETICLCFLFALFRDDWRLVEGNETAVMRSEAAEVITHHCQTELNPVAAMERSAMLVCNCPTLYGAWSRVEFL